jgi:hypothetical protein
VGIFLKLFLGLIILSTLSACQFRADTKPVDSATLQNNDNSPSTPTPGAPGSGSGTPGGSASFPDSTSSSQPPSSGGSPGNSGQPSTSVVPSEPTIIVSDAEVIPPGTEPISSPSAIEPQDIQCIQSLCGTNSPLPHPTWVNDQLKELAKVQIDSQIKRPLQKYMGRIIHKALLQDEMFKKLFQSQAQIQVSPEKSAFLLSVRYLNRLGTYMTTVQQDSQGRYKFNLDALRAKVGNGPGKEDEVQAIAKLTDLLNFLIYRGPMFDYQLELLIKLMYQDVSTTEALKQEANIMQLVRNYVGTMIPSMNYVKPSDLVLKKAMNGEPLSFTEKGIFKGEMKQRYVLGYLLVPEVQEAFKKLKLDIPSIMAEAKQLYLNSKPALAVANPQSIKGLLQTSVQSCSAKLGFSYSALPSKGQMDRFVRIFDQIQMTAQAMIEQRTQSSFSEPLKIQLITPPTREAAIVSWANSLNDAVEISDAALKDIKKIDMNKPETVGDAFVSLATFSDGDMFETINDFCDQAKLPFLDDAALRGMYLINISWPTVVYPRMGTGIIAHEVGHIISGQFSNIVQPEQNCLKQKQQSDQYAEEDFADLFSSELVRRMNFQAEGGPIGHYACSLHQMTEDGWARGSLQPVPNDTHSSGFFRIIATAVMTGHQTPQCKSYLQSVGETRFQNYCKWQ